MTTQPNDPGQHYSSDQQSSVPARRSPRDIAEQLWDAFPFGDMPWPLRDVGRGSGMPMRVEEFRDGGDLVVRAELPGVDPEKDVEVTVDEGVLTISAHREERTEERQARGYRSEFRYGRLERQIRLPKGAGTEEISASYRDGVLEVRLPVPEEIPPARKISIRRG